MKPSARKHQVLVKVIILSLIVLGITLPVYSQKNIEINKDKEIYLVEDNLFYLVDTKGTLTIEDVLKKDQEGLFQLNHNKIFIKSASGNIYWLKLTITNYIQKEAWIELGSTFLWYIDFYIPDGDSYKLLTKTGSLRPASNKAYPSNLYWLPISTSKERQTVYIRIETQRPVEIPIYIGSTLELSQKKTQNDFLTGAFVGLLFIMFAYNLSLYFTTRDKSYIWYIIYLVAIVFTATFINNYPIIHYLFDDKLNFWIERYFFCWFALTYFSVGMFMLAFLQLSKNAHYFSIFIKSLIVIICVLVPIVDVFGWVAHYQLIHFYQIIVPFYGFSFLFISFYLWLFVHNKNARFYTLAWSWVTISAIVYFLTINGYIPFNLYTRNALYFGITLEVLMFSLALGDRFNNLRKEKLAVEKENLKLVQEQNHLLAVQLKEGMSQIRKQQEEIQSKEESFKFIANNTSDALVFIQNGDVSFISEAYEKLFGYTPEEEIKRLKKGLWHFLIFEEDTIKVKEILREVLRQKTTYFKYEYRYRHKDGRVLWKEDNVNNFYDTSGNIEKSILIVRDITEQKSTEDLLQQKVTELFEIKEILERNNTEMEIQALILQESNKAKDKIFSIVAHDLRSPLASLKSLLGLLETRNMTKEDFFDFLPDLNHKINGVYDLTEELLYWARNQMNVIDISPVQINIKELFEESIIRFKEQSEAKGIILYSESVDPKFEAHADLDMVKTVLRNLISNAIKFCKEDDKIVLKAKEEDQFIEINISDTGVGIKPENVPRLFSSEGFTTYGTGNEKGTGLGLTLCKDLIEKNGGTIWVESTLDVGSDFYFKLPKDKS